MRRVFIGLFNALGACAAVYAVIELMRIIGYYWTIVLMPYPLTYLEFAFLAIGILWIVLAVIDNLYIPADLLGLNHKGNGVFGKNIKKSSKRKS